MPRLDYPLLVAGVSLSEQNKVYIDCIALHVLSTNISGFHPLGREFLAFLNLQIVLNYTSEER